MEKSNLECMDAGWKGVFDMPDTIAAIATAQGTGGIGVIRISGPQAREVVGKVFRSPSGKRGEELGGYRAL